MIRSNHSSTRIIAITGTTVIPMDTNRLLESHTVTIRDGLIESVGPTHRMEIPDSARIVDGTGKYLIPGLANMHAHLFDFDSDPRHLALYLAGGVCTVRSLNSRDEIFEWRAKTASGDWLGPTIMMSGPAIVGFPHDHRLLAIGLRSATVLAFGLASAALLAIAYLAAQVVAGMEVAETFLRSWGVIWIPAGILIGIVAVWKKLVPLRWLAARFLPMASVVETPAQARSEVGRQIKTGVDFIKPYDYLDRDTYFATLQTARQAGVYSLGHIPEAPEVVHVKEALEAGLNEVAHVDELTHAFLVDYDPSIRRWMEWELDTTRIDEIARTIADYGAAVTATLVTNEIVLLGLEDMDVLFQRPEYLRIRAEKIEKWKTGGRMVRWQGQETYRRNRLRPLWMALTASLHRAGVPVLLGTDSDVEGIVPGISEHRELELLVEVGFTPFEALAAGTRDAARIAKRMKAESNWGTIEVGNRADLVLLSKNPLTDIGNSSDIHGVVVRGRWLAAQDLEREVSDYLGRTLEYALSD